MSKHISLSNLISNQSSFFSHRKETDNHGTIQFYKNYITKSKYATSLLKSISNENEHLCLDYISIQTAIELINQVKIKNKYYISNFDLEKQVILIAHERKNQIAETIKNISDEIQTDITLYKKDQLGIEKIENSIKRKILREEYNKILNNGLSQTEFYNQYYWDAYDFFNHPFVKKFNIFRNHKNITYINVNSNKHILDKKIYGSEVVDQKIKTDGHKPSIDKTRAYIILEISKSLDIDLMNQKRGDRTTIKKVCEMDSQFQDTLKRTLINGELRGKAKAKTIEAATHSAFGKAWNWLIDNRLTISIKRRNY